jgi:hypothetical protein
MAENKTPYTKIAKLSSGEKWLLGLLGVEITVSCTRTKYDGYISFVSHNCFYSGKGLEKIDSFSVKFSHEGTMQSNITDDDIYLGAFSPFMCDSNYGKYGAEGISEASKIKTDVVDKIETYRKPPFAPPMRGGIYFYMHSQKKDDNTIPKTFYRKATLLSFTTTDGVVHSIDNLNY